MPILHSNIEYECIDATWFKHKTALEKIRRDVFIVEQAVPEALEWESIDSDTNTHHLLVSKSDCSASTDANTYEVKTCNSKTSSSNTYVSTPVACVRIHIKDSRLKISRLAVQENFRLQGIGALLLKNALDYALAKTPSEIYLNAQIQALEFYHALGFIECGDIFDEAGISHQKMQFNQNSYSAIKKLYATHSIRLSLAEDYLRHFRQMSRLCSRSIDILSLDFRADFYGSNIISQACSLFVRSNKHSKIRILIENAEDLHKYPHDLIALAQRVPSKIEIKILKPESEPLKESFCLFDRTSLIYFNKEHEMKGIINYDNRSRNNTLKEKFESLWNYQSSIDKNLVSFVL